MKLVSFDVVPALALTLAFLPVTGCDPMRRINMINESGQNAEIIWVIKEDSILKSPFFISNSDSVVFYLKKNKPYNTVKMSFGTGAWTSDELTNLTDDLKSMEIHASSGNIKLDSSADIKTFLFLRRREFDHSKIRIVIPMARGTGIRN